MRTYNGFEKMMLVAKILTNGTVYNRYLFHRVCDQYGPVRAGICAVVGRFWHGR